MKTVMLLLLAMPLVATECDKGCAAYRDTCTCESVPDYGPPIKPSDEKPPRSGIAASEGAMPGSLAVQDSNMDLEKRAADIQGKRAAGIN